MLDFPFMLLPGGISRPMIGAAIEGPLGRRLLDGLLDTGSDRTIFPHAVAAAIGIQLSVRADGTIKTAGGVSIAYRLADVILELRAQGTIIRWQSSVAFADAPLSLIHLGNRGFLEYFHCNFLGPEKRIALDPRPTLPRL